MKFDKLIEEFVNSLDFDGTPTLGCPTIHPTVEKALWELEDAKDFEIMWQWRLSKLQQVERHCLATELQASLMDYLPVQAYKAVEPELRNLLLYVISAAWLVHSEVEKKFGEQK